MSFMQQHGSHVARIVLPLHQARNSVGVVDGASHSSEDMTNDAAQSSILARTSLVGVT
jgi:hypothetical protein